MGQDVTLPQAALPLTGGSRHARIASDECSAALWRRLSESDAANDCVRDIARSPALRQEVTTVLPRLQAWAAPITDVTLTRRLTELGQKFYLEDRSDEEWAVFWKFYRDALRTLPEAAFEDAIVKWNQQGTDFMPKASQLYKLAEPMMVELRTVAWRAKKASEWVEEHAERYLTPEERQARGAEIRAILAQPLPRIPPQPPGVTAAEWARRCLDEGLTETPPTPAPAGESPQQMAARLHRAAAAPDADDEEAV